VSIFLAGEIHNEVFYNNTLYLTGSGYTAAAVATHDTLLSTSSVTFYNNIFSTTQGAPLIDALPGTTDGLVFLGNDYYPNGAQFVIDWDGTPYIDSDITRWQQAAQEEIVNGSNVARTDNPQFLQPGQGHNIDNPNDPSYINNLATLLDPYYGSAAPLASAIDVSSRVLWDPYSMGLKPPADFSGAPLYWHTLADPETEGAYEFPH
jgi:hypothetical protein